MPGAEQWIVLAELVPAWANELADASHSPGQLEHDLWQCLHEDGAIGFLDYSGPLKIGRRWGLCVVDYNGEFRYVSGRLLLGRVPFPFRRSGHRILLAKKATLDFARRHRLPPPSWWKRETQRSRSQVLKPASDRMIREAIGWAYDAAEEEGRKPPNIKELAAAVQPFLQQKGFSASGRRIQQLGADEEFKRRRRPPGKTVASERQK
jgi:hypothetical protein